MTTKIVTKKTHMRRHTYTATASLDMVHKLHYEGNKMNAEFKMLKSSYKNSSINCSYFEMV